MAGIDWRESPGEHRREGGLRPLQFEGDLVITVRRYVGEVFICDLARVEPQLVGPLIEQQVPGALDIGGGERLAVMPFDVLTQLEGQRGVVLVPRPACRQFADYRAEADLRLHLPFAGIAAAFIELGRFDDAIVAGKKRHPLVLFGVEYSFRWRRAAATSATEPRT